MCIRDSSPVMLRLMDTPETVLPDSISYFRTYFTGSLACVLYNICLLYTSPCTSAFSAVSSA